MFAIRRSDAPDVSDSFPGGIHPFNRVYVQQESQDINPLFRQCYRGLGDSKVILFGGDDLVDAVLNQRQEGKDAFVTLEPNPDTTEGTASYLDEILAMVLVVQAGKQIRSYLDISD